MNSLPDISVTIPVYNEEKILGELYRRLSASVSGITDNYELIFINDGSHDCTLEKLKELSQSDHHVKFISFSRNFGHQIAIMAGINSSSGKAVVIIDGDLQDPPELIGELYEKYKEGYKVVYAKRRKREGETFFKKFTATIFYRIMAKMTSVDIPLDTGDYRLMDRQVVETLKRMPEQNKFLRGQIAWIGFKQTFVEFDREKRPQGRTGYTLGKMLRFAFDGITAFSNTPLRIASILGFVFSTFAFFVILYALYSKFVLHRVVTGWTSLMISTMFIGGIQLLAIGIIGEYISRISIDVKKRPLYVVDESNLSDERIK